MMKDESFTNDSRFSEYRYIEYQPGNTNLILSVPHGGKLRPKPLPNRMATAIDIIGSDQLSRLIKTKCDLYTIELATFIASYITEYTGKKPHVIICHLHRSKLDCNTTRYRGALNVPQCVSSWRSYHRFINIAKRSFSGRGLLIDLHGQSHPENWVELGYTVSESKLNTKQYTAANTSIRSLHNSLMKDEHNITIDQLIRGSHSMSEMFNNEGIVAVPSDHYMIPDGGNYFSGGYTVKRHGSRYKGVVDAIQIESPQELRKPENCHEYAKKLARIIIRFLNQYY